MAKRARHALDLRSLSNLRGISRNALYEVLSRLNLEDAEVTRESLRRDSVSRFQEVCHLLKMPAAEGSGTVDWHFCHPLKTLDLLLRENDILQGWYLNALERQRIRTLADPHRLG